MEPRHERATESAVTFFLWGISTMRTFRPLLFVVSLFAISLRAAAQTVVPGTPAAPMNETELFRWAITQGGLVVVVLVVVWSYRRDFQRIFTSEQERTRELIMALQASTSAITMQAEVTREQAHTDRENAKAFLELSASVRACEAIRDSMLPILRQRTDTRSTYGPKE